MGATELLINLLVLVVLLAGLTWLRHRLSLAQQVLLGMAAGVALGLRLQLVYGAAHPAIAAFTPWLELVGQGYVHLLQMVVMPLVLVAVLAAVARVPPGAALGRMGLLLGAVLLGTTAVAAVVGIAVSLLFDLDARGLVQGAAEMQRLAELHTQGGSHGLGAPQLLLSLVPQNPFADLAGSRPSAVIGVVIFALFLGVAALRLKREHPEQGRRALELIELLQLWVMALVRVVLRFTPYGVLALMAKVVATSSGRDIVRLGHFVAASYVGLGVLLAFHGFLLLLCGIRPWHYMRRAAPVLGFALTSRSSAASIPLNVTTQTRHLGVPESIASLAASLGATMGQNGCAGLYPAMLAMMTAPAVGIDPLDPMWLAMLVGIVTLSSVGVAGVGGGATFAALLVLPAMGLPVTLAALLVSIEPLIDMGRTAVNVSGSMTAGVVTSRLLRQGRDGSPVGKTQNRSM